VGRCNRLLQASGSETTFPTFLVVRASAWPMAGNQPVVCRVTSHGQAERSARAWTDRGSRASIPGIERAVGT